MNRSLTLVCFWAIFSACGLLQAQNVMLCQQVLASAGKTGKQGARYFTYTVGEPFIATLSGAAYKATQGFHQPELCKLVSANNIDLEKWHLEVFPNPTGDWVNLRFDRPEDTRLYLRVYDLLGRTVLEERALTETNLVQLDCSAWQAGVYILQFCTRPGNGFANYKLIKL